MCYVPKNIISTILPRYVILVGFMKVSAAIFIRLPLGLVYIVSVNVKS